MPRSLVPGAAAQLDVAPGLHAAVLDWYAAGGRTLAFRATADPYAILVSEFMAQQTQAQRAAEYWSRFIVEFPTVRALAAATPAAVLRAWRGLGYNRRALALRRAAIVTVEEHGGRVPADLAALLRLPGVGPYTARAVAALAFGRRVGPVDVNVRRVLSRALGGSLDAYAAAELQAIADAVVPAEDPGTWTHALMDIGATFCLPRVPACTACPAAAVCRFANQESAAVKPNASERVAIERVAAEPVSADGPAHGARQQARSMATSRERHAPFESTNRWLRGRILDLLRDATGEDWVTIPATIGVHGRDAIERAVSAMEREGLLERVPGRTDMARLPIG